MDETMMSGLWKRFHEKYTYATIEGLFALDAQRRRAAQGMPAQRIALHDGEAANA